MRLRSRREFWFHVRYLVVPAAILAAVAVVFQSSVFVFALVVAVPVYLGVVKVRHPGSTRAVKRILREYPWRDHGYRLEMQGAGMRARLRVVLIDGTGRALGSFDGPPKLMAGSGGSTRGRLRFAGNPVYGGVMWLPGNPDCGVFLRPKVPRHTDTPDEAARARRARILHK